MKFRIALGLFVLTLGCADGPPSRVSLSPADWPEGELNKYTRLGRTGDQAHRVAEGAKGMIVSTNEPLAIRAGLEALKQGGTAADAAIATSLAQVSMAAGCWVSYAGIMTMVYYEAETGRVHSMNAAFNTVKEEDDPLSIPHPGNPSGRTALVPGYVAGIQACHDRFGRLPFSELFEPAIYFAENGFEITSKLGRYLKIRKEVLARLPETREIFAKENGEFYAEGDLFKQPQFAETLRKTAEQGADYMYKGEWAKKFIETIRREGGKMTMEDLENYQVQWTEPLHTNYRGNEIYTLSLPNFGGIDLIEGIHLLEAANLSDRGHYTESPEALYKFIQITRVPFLIGPQGTRLGVSPELVKKHIPEYDLSPESRVKRKSAELIWAKIESPEWQILRKEALEMRMEASTAIGQVLKDLRKPGHSDAVVVFDEMGNVAAMIHSINAAYWGTSGIFVDGVSIPDSGAHQQTLIKEVGPGGRMPDPTHPLIVMKEGEPVLAGGTIGSLGLLGATMQNLANILDFGMEPKASVDTPNFLGPELIPAESYKQVFVEGEFSEEILEAIRGMGQEVEIVPGDSRGLFCGNWVGIQRDPETGKLVGGVPYWLKGIAEGYN